MPANSYGELTLCQALLANGFLVGARLCRINAFTRNILSHLIGIQIDGPDSFSFTKTDAR